MVRVCKKDAVLSATQRGKIVELEEELDAEREKGDALKRQDAMRSRTIADLQGQISDLQLSHGVTSGSEARLKSEADGLRQSLLDLERRAAESDARHKNEAEGLRQKVLEVEQLAREDETWSGTME